MIRLGVNIDHVATLRQARRTTEPDPIEAASIVERAGADGITVHLREDRRHIQTRDVEMLRKTVKTRLNLEMAATREIMKIACRIRPNEATLVPEKRQEITTEGGLNVVKSQSKIYDVVKALRKKGIIVSLFIEPSKHQVNAAKKVEADCVELHTGSFADAKTKNDVRKQLGRLAQAAALAKSLGLGLNAGHGLTYVNIALLIKKIPEVEELNIGHSIISRAVIVGLEQAVMEMRTIINQAQQRARRK